MEEIKINFTNHNSKPVLDQSFYDWFDNQLIVKSYPKLTDELLEYDTIINVSDEFNPKIFEYCISKGVKCHWFPMSESNSNMGLHSIYGAIKILSLCEKENKRVLLHCHVGANRSPSVKESYYIMRTQEHFTKEKTPKVIMNIDFGHLPSFYEYYNFLISIGEHRNFLDVCIDKSINSK